MSIGAIYQPGDVPREAVEIVNAMLDDIEPLANPVTKNESAGAFAKRVFKLVDYAIAAGNEVTLCRSGCHYCCHYRVLASPTEVFALAEHVITTWTPDRLVALKGRLTKHVATVKPMSVAEHMTTNVPCPLLDNGSCAVYALRPVACRAHHEVMSIDTCKETFENPHSPRDGAKSMATTAAGEAARYGMGLFMHRAGRDDNEYELGSALHEALTNPASARRYRKGSSAFPGVRDRQALGPRW